MADVKELADAVAKLAPLAKAILDVQSGVADLAQLEAKAAAARQAAGEAEKRRAEVVASTDKTLADHTANVTRAQNELVSARNEAERVTQVARENAANLLASTKVEAQSVADNLKHSRDDEVRALDAEIAQRQLALEAVTATLTKRQGEHDAVLASMESLKSRLG